MRVLCLIESCCLPKFQLLIRQTAAMAHGVRSLAPQAEGFVFECQPRHTLVVKTVSDSPAAKRSAIGMSVTGSRR